MGQAELYKILEYILNEATDKEIQVIVSAIEKRRKDGSSMLSGLNLKKMSQHTSSSIQEQLSMPVENIRQMIREMVVKMIRQSAPDIPDEHLEVLLKEWVPDPGSAPAAKSPLPPDVLLTMIKHFTKYSTGKMTPGELATLKKTMPNWHEEYWNHFPGPVQGLLSKYINGEIKSDLFWQAVKEAVK